VGRGLHGSTHAPLISLAGRLSSNRSVHQIQGASTSGRSADCGSTACTDKTAPNLGISQALRVAFDGLVKSVREEPILQGMTDLSTTVMCHFYNQACTAIVNYL